MNNAQTKLAVLMGQTVHILASESLTLTSKLSFNFLSSEERQVKITNIVFFSEFLVCALTLDNEVVVMNYLNNEVVFRSRIGESRYYLGQMLMFNKKAVMSKMGKLIFVTEEISLIDKGSK